MLVDGRQVFREGLIEHLRSIRMSARRQGVTLLDPHRIAPAAPVLARVDWGRWIADCPDCNGAEMVWIEGPLVLMCQSCWNRAINGLWRRVQLPSDRAAIEAALEPRAEPYRNWRPGETAEMLLAENRLHNLGS